MKRLIIPCRAALFCVLIVLLLTGTAAAEWPDTAGDFVLVVDSLPYDGSLFLVNGNTAYVSLREFACMADNSVVTWNTDSMTAAVTTDSLKLTVCPADSYITANGRVLWCENGILCLDGLIYVPVRQIARAFGFETEYVESENTAYLTRTSGSILPGDEYYDPEDLYWLSKIIHAESAGEPFLGKLAVGTVILNRVDSDEFPDSIYDVIFDSENGTQFTPTSNGAILKEAGDEAVLAAKICLEDTRLSGGMLYFLNEALAESHWITENCTFVVSIGAHDFYRD